MAVLALLVLAIALPQVSLAQAGPDTDADTAQGYTNNIFHHSSVDSINAYNGQLTIPIALGPSYPIGPKLKFQAMLTYNSKVWEFGNPNQQNQTGAVYKPKAGDPALGTGWRFTVGAIRLCGLNQNNYCYYGPDGSEHPFTGSAVGPCTDTSDASQLCADFNAFNSEWEMWDGDGNHYEFHQHVSGYDDDPLNYTHDFGRGRDGWYLTKLTDPFNNSMLVTYWPSLGSQPCWTYQAGVNPLFQMQCPSTVTNSWIPQSIVTPTATINVNLGSGNGTSNMITSIVFPVLAGGSLTTATWTLAYGSTVTYGWTNLQTLSSLQPPTAQYSFTYGPSAGNSLGLVQTMTLPTGGVISYAWTTYSFFHARAGSLGAGCAYYPPPSGTSVLVNGRLPQGQKTDAPTGGGPAPPAQPLAPGNCPKNTNPNSYLDQAIGIARRTETAVSGQDASTDYIQYAFPFGELGSQPSSCPPSHECSRTLTLIVFPQSIEGQAHSTATLFSGPGTHDGSTLPGDPNGADMQTRVFDRDTYCNPDCYPSQPPTVNQPACGGTNDNPFCPSHSIRMTARTFKYGNDDAGYYNRHLQSQTVYYQPPNADGSCPSCSSHTVTYSNVTGPTWEGNGRHYNIESHTGNLGNDTRTSTTTWTPVTTPYLPNLMSQQTTVDSTMTVNRYFEYKTDSTANGFLIGSAVWDSVRSRTFLSCFYNDGHGNSGQEFSATYPNQSSAPNNACQTYYPTFPTVGVGVNSDAFGKIHTYQNGLRLTSRWMATPTTPATWYLRNYVRDATTGWITTSSDTAGLATTYQYDSLGRVTLVTPPGSEIAASVSYPSTTQTIAQRSGGPGLSTYEEYDFDGLGRPIRNRRLMPGGQYSKQFTLYDLVGHAYFHSEWVADATSETLSANLATTCAYWSSPSFSAFEPSAAPGTYRLCYDPFDRPQQAVGSNFSSLTTVSRTDVAWYSDTLEAATVACLNGPLQTTGSCSSGGINATTTDRKDAFGRLTSVTEPTGDVTSYTYDVNAKLTGVTQGTQSRTFTYDPVGLLRQEITPEKGTVTYNNYGSLGNLLQRTENDGTVISGLYDFGGRLACQGQGTTTATDCPSATSLTMYAQNYYDGNTGRLTQRIGSNPVVSGTPTFTDTFSYSNTTGRLSQLTTAAAGALGTVGQSWTYNLLGLVGQDGQARPTTGSPAPLVITTTYDAALPAALYANGIPIAAGISYSPAGALSGYTTGMSIGLHVQTTIAQDPAGLPRPSRVSAQPVGPYPILFDTGTYAYDGVGNILSMTRSSTDLDTFSYDNLSRLTSAALSGLGSQNFSYDRYGNLLSVAGVLPRTLCTAPCTNNRLNGLGAVYDNGAANGRGNLTSTTSEGYTYDALDRTVSVSSGWAYAYDGAYERVARIPPSGAWTYTLRDEQGRVSAEFSGNSQSRDNIFLGHQIIASYANPNVGGNGPIWSFYVSDHLGTPRLVTDVNGGSPDKRNYWPFGEQTASTASFERVRFAAMEQDPEAGTGNDRYYDHARHHGSLLGRFLSTDRVMGRVSHPQTWNRYTYAANNPIKFVDQTGLDFFLSGCAGALDSATCGQQKALLQQAVGNKAYGYLQVGAGGKVTFNGITGAEFAKQFGTAAHGLAYLVAAKSVFTLNTGPSVWSDLGGGGAFRPGSNSIYINTANFPKSIGGIEASAAEAFVHELGHAVATVIPGVAAAVNQQAQPHLRGLFDQLFQPRLPLSEGYATAFENQYRRETVGADKLRQFYGQEGDYVDPGPGASLFPRQ